MAIIGDPRRLLGITSDDSKQWGVPFWSGYRAAPNTASIGCGFLAVVSLPTSDVSSTVPLALIAITTVAACASLGGGLYEFLVVDPAWPKRPGIIQPRNGGVSRARFWIPAHVAFEVLLIATLVVAWGDADVRVALLVALVSHGLMRVWSLVDFVPKAVAFEKADPATVDEAAAVRWTRRSLLRLPLDLITCAAMLTALAGYH